jgi:AcrR family transcriptional regulator
VKPPSEPFKLDLQPDNQKHRPTPESRAKVALWAQVGTTMPTIASELGISVQTLSRHYKDELEEARAKGVAKVAATLYSKAIAGDTSAMIFFLRTQGVRAGWIEKQDDKPNTVIQLDLVKTITQTISAMRHGAPAPAMQLARTIESKGALAKPDGADLL